MNADGLFYVVAMVALFVKSNCFVTQRSENDANCSCVMAMEPVCGTDGTSTYTYINRCILECNRRSRPELRRDYDGFCCDHSHCPVRVQPVCDSVGRRHLNECFFRYAQCLDERKFGKRISIPMHRIDCDCNRECTMRDDPICDNYGNTHINLCFFRNAQCYAMRKFGTVLNLDYFGTCCNALLCQHQPFVKPKHQQCYHMGSIYRLLCDFHVAKCVAEKKQITGFA